MASRDLTPGLFGPDDPPKKKTRPRAKPRPPVQSFGLYAEVALNKPLRQEFTYGVPDPLRDAVAVGSRVAVPFGSRREVGVVVRTSESSTVARGKVRPLLRVLDDVLVAPDLLELCAWIADRYACAWGEALAAALPAALRAERGARKVVLASSSPDVGDAELAELEERWPKQHRLLRTLIEIDGEIELRELCRRLNVSESPARTLAKRGWIRIRSAAVEPTEPEASASDRPRPETLTDEQQNAVTTIGLAIDFAKHRSYLLQGVTGSGKTEVYLRAIEHALEKGRGAIILVPEISLTPQTVGWFRARFGEVAVLHSRLTDAQRLATWRRVESGQARVVVGARSAIFAPVRDLGVVVVDEEHEPSFKQGNTPRYHARDVALERARLSDAVCLLGSATPALETWHAAHQGRHAHLRLQSRPGGKPLPPVHLIDMRTEPRREGKGRALPILSAQLHAALRDTLRRKEQAILFLNRRGYTRVLYCPGCSSPVRCEQCSSSLTVHRRIWRAVCHLCCEETAIPEQCPQCTFPGLVPLGVGVEQLERALRAEYPDANVRRMDSDTMLRFEDYAAVLDAFGRGEVDVLVGTQMIAKGLDFPGVTLVGIVDADSGLYLPDFRAHERTHQLIAQVAGRAGRGSREGRIVVQTREPEHFAITTAARHDFDAFAERECEERRAEAKPPFSRLLRLVIEDPDEKLVVEVIDRITERLRVKLAGSEASVWGPGTPTVELLRGRHRRELSVWAPPDGKLLGLARDEIFAAASPKVRMAIDVDPVSLF